LSPQLSATAARPGATIEGMNLTEARAAVEFMEQEYLETASDFYRHVDDEALTLTTALAIERQLERTRRALRRAKETLAAR
jgi:hypothetical protein